VEATVSGQPVDRPVANEPFQTTEDEHVNTESATVKIPDGKLLEVTVSWGDRIDAVRLTGDFFLEPPEARAELEAAIEGSRVDIDRETLVRSIESVDARLIGFEAAHLADATLEAVR